MQDIAYNNPGGRGLGDIAYFKVNFMPATTDVH